MIPWPQKHIKIVSLIILIFFHFWRPSWIWQPFCRNRGHFLLWHISPFNSPYPKTPILKFSCFISENYIPHLNKRNSWKFSLSIGSIREMGFCSPFMFFVKLAISKVVSNNNSIEKYCYEFQITEKYTLGKFAYY